MEGMLNTIYGIPSSGLESSELAETASLARAVSSSSDVTSLPIYMEIKNKGLDAVIADIKSNFNQRMSEMSEMFERSEKLHQEMFDRFEKMYQEMPEMSQKLDMISNDLSISKGKNIELNEELKKVKDTNLMYDVVKACEDFIALKVGATGSTLKLKYNESETIRDSYEAYMKYVGTSLNVQIPDEFPTYLKEAKDIRGETAHTKMSDFVGKGHKEFMEIVDSYFPHQKQSLEIVYSFLKAVVDKNAEDYEKENGYLHTAVAIAKRSNPSFKNYQSLNLDIGSP